MLSFHHLSIFREVVGKVAPFFCCVLMACMVQPNKSINGAVLNTSQYLVSPYADNTDFILDGSKWTLDIVRSFEYISQYVGFKD